MVGRIAWTVGRGILAGLAGTAAMTASSTIEMRLRGRPPSMTPALAAEAVLGIEPDSPEAEARLSDVVHWSYGAAWGLPAVVLHALRLRGPLAAGAHFGLMWGSALVLLPGLRVVPPASEWGSEEIAIDAIHHAVYAFATTLVYEVL